MPRDPNDEELTAGYPPAGSPYGFHKDPGGPGLEQDMEQLRQEAEVQRKFRDAHKDGPPKRAWWRFWKR